VSVPVSTIFAFLDDANPVTERLNFGEDVGSIAGRVLPARLISATHSRKVASIKGSKPDVGSSRMKSSTSEARAADQGNLLSVALSSRCDTAWLGQARSVFTSSSRRDWSKPPRNLAKRSITSPPEKARPQVHITRPRRASRRWERQTASRHGSPPSTLTFPAFFAEQPEQDPQGRGLSGRHSDR